MDPGVQFGPLDVKMRDLGYFRGSGPGPDPGSQPTRKWTILGVRDGFEDPI